MWLVLSAMLMCVPSTSCAACPAHPPLPRCHPAGSLLTQKIATDELADVCLAFNTNHHLLCLLLLCLALLQTLPFPLAVCSITC
jgi:hypothetical protein